MPGADIAESMRIVLGEVDLPYAAELPARGAAATMVGRTLALVSGLGVDLQPAGWRLTDASGTDHRRAVSLLAHDLDIVEELSQRHTGAFKVQVTGPWTLAATVERPRGDKVLADHGARRDLAQALADGVAGHVDDVRRRTGSTEIVVQIDEPALPAVLAAAIPTASGFGRHRSVTNADAAAALDWVAEAALGAGGIPVLHCCAPALPWRMVAQTRVQAVSFDLTTITKAEYDDVAGWVESGHQAWPGLVPAVDPDDWPTGADLTRALLRWWSDLGYTEVETLPDMTVTPTCGLAAASPGWARAALGLAAQVSRNLSAEQGKIAP